MTLGTEVRSTTGVGVGEGSASGVDVGAKDDAVCVGTGVSEGNIVSGCAGVEAGAVGVAVGKGTEVGVARMDASPVLHPARDSTRHTRSVLIKGYRFTVALPDGNSGEVGRAGAKASLLLNRHRDGPAC